MATAIFYVRWLVGGAALVFFVLAALINVRILYRSWFKQGRESLLPGVGGICGALGWITIPMPEFLWLAWLPLMLDVGCLPAIMVAILQSRAHSSDDGERGRDKDH